MTTDSTPKPTRLRPGGPEKFSASAVLRQLWLGILLVIAAISPASAAEYTYVKVGNPAQTGSSAMAMDSRGRVATTSLIRSFLFADNFFANYVEITNVNVATSTPGMVAQGMNDLGEVVGRFRTNGAPANQTRGFIRRADGTVEPFDYPGVASTSISEINNHGHLVGETRSDLTAFGLIRGFVHTNGVSAEIHFPGATLTRAYGINDAGDIVGQYQMDDAVSRPFLLRGGVYAQIVPVGAPGGLASAIAFSISDNGLVLGTYRDSANISKTWVMRPNGAFEYPSLPGAGRVINNAGQIAGSFVDANNANAATPYVATPKSDVNFLVHRIELTNSASSTANKINGFGQITGTVDGADGVSRGYRFDIATGLEVERAGYPGSGFTEWGGVTSSGTLAGYYADPADPNFGTYRAFTRDSGGNYKAITWPGDPDFGFTVDIDEHGRVAGGGNNTAWVWHTNGTFQVFAVPGFQVNGSFGMNDHGIVVGAAWPGFFDTPNGLIYNISNNTATIWNYPGAAQTTLYGINNRGDIVGEFKPNLTSANIPFVRWADGSTQVLNLPGLTGARVYDISNDRVIVGRYKDAANKNRSFYATPIAPLPDPLAFTFETLDLPGVASTLLSDIRNDGALVGRYIDGGGISQGFVQRGANLTTFNVTGTTATFAAGLDNLGRIAGFYRNLTNPEIQHGFIRETNGAITTIDGPGQTFTYAWRINDAGQVNGYWFEDPFFIRSFLRATNGTLTTNLFAGSPVGTVTRGMNEAGDTAGWKWDDNFTLQGVVFAGGQTNVFTVAGWENTLPGDINNFGDIAGTVNNGFTNTAGFFRRADGAVVTFTPPGAVEVEVFGLNDLGQVVGEYADAGGNRHGFIAHPAAKLSSGHTDVGIGFEDGAFDLHIHDEETDTEYGPGGAVLCVLPAAEQNIPDTAAFGFLGRPGYSTWILPAAEDENLLFLGFGAEEIESGVFVGNALRMELVSVVGAGDFAVYSNDGFGNPIVHINSADGISAADFMPLVAGGHQHVNWAFGAPGTYRIGFRARGTLVQGNQPVVSEVAYYTFTVPAAQRPQPVEPDDSFVYNPVDLGAFGGSAFANALGINNAGVVVGGANFPDNKKFHPYRFSGNGPKEDLGTAGGDIAGANDINEAGEITGTTFLVSGQDEPYLPFRYTTNGVMQVIPNTLGGLNGEAAAINDAGRIVGSADLAPGKFESVAFYADADNVMHSLGTFGGTESRAENINNAGYIVGNAQLANGERRAFRHLGNGVLNQATDDLGTLGGNRSQAHAINAAGKVTGTSRIPGNASSPAFLWEEGKGMANLGTLGAGTLAYGFAMNSNDVVVGWSLTVSNDFNSSQAFVWDRNHGMRNLNDLVPRGSGLLMDGAYGINDHGWIAGTAKRLIDGAATPVLLKPATRLKSGDTDIGIAFEDGAFDLHVHAETIDQEFSPDAALLHAAATTYGAVPTNAAYAFLGAAGAPVWTLPAVEDPRQLFLGIAAEEIERGVFVRDEIKLTLTAVNGPGHFALYTVDGFGVPQVRMNTRDGLDANDSVIAFAGSHQHYNWGFSAPGLYRVRVKASGTLAAGSRFVESEEVEYFFEVIGIETDLSIARSGGNAAISFVTQDGLTYQLESAPAVTGPWTNEGAVFLGTGRMKQITVPLNSGAQFFRMKAENGN